MKRTARWNLGFLRILSLDPERPSALRSPGSTVLNTGAAVTLSRIRAHARDAFGRANVLTVVLLLLALLPLAHASPPDPTWIAGIYDDADLDEAVAAVTNADVLTECDSLTEKTIFVVRDGALTLDAPANAPSGGLLGI